MKENIVVITDTCVRKLVAMVEIKNILKDLHILKDARFDHNNFTISTDKLDIYIHDLNSAMPIRKNSETIAWTIYDMNNPVSSQIAVNIRRWRKIEDIAMHMPKSAEDVPFECLDQVLKKYEVKNETRKRMV